MTPDVSVIILAHGDEPYLEASVKAALASTPQDDAWHSLEVLVVDNGALVAVSALPDDERLRRLHPGANLGFAGGCNQAVEASGSELLVFVNSDAIVEPDTVTALAHALAGPTVGLATGCVLLAAHADRVNAAGNPVHFTGLAWSGGYGDAVAMHRTARDVTSFSGALFACKRDTWLALGGFDADYFLYHEDVDLSLRAWSAGLRVRYVPEARATHHYEFSRNADKYYLLERNRLATVLTTFPAELLRRLAPGLLIFEMATWILALFQGWLPEKIRGYAWLWRHRQQLRKKREQVQSSSVLSPRAFLSLLEAHLTPTNVEAPGGLAVLDTVLARSYRRALRTLSDMS